MSDEVLIRAEHVGKKFCRTLKRSLWYGVTDILEELAPWRRNGHDRAPDAAGLDEPHAPELRKGEFWALQDVSFELRRGECLGLIGHNGAGKSTLLKILNGLIKPDTGRIEMRGRVGALIELNAGFNPILTGRENVYNKGAVLGFTKREIDERFDEIIDFAEIGDFIDMPVQNYSSGMKVRLGFAVSAQMEPDILLVDEVLAVGDTAFRLKCMAAMSELLKNTAVIFVSHSMPQIFRVCSEVMLLRNGRELYCGRNVGEGVAKYFSLCSSSEKHTVGTGQVRLATLELDSNGSHASMGGELVTEHGSDLRVALDLNMDHDLDCVAVQLIIWNMELHPIMNVIGPNGRGAILKNNRDGVSRISTTIPCLALNGGKYSITVNVTDPENMVTYMMMDNAASLNVQMHFFSGANVILPTTWRMDRQLSIDAKASPNL
jgi:lipopolysaccharide transport system ATP-binding protein